MTTLDKERIVSETERYVKTLLEGDGSGHDWWHIVRVRKMAARLASQIPRANPFIVVLGALLHDVGDHKFHKGDTSVGPKMVEQFLQGQNLDEKSTDVLVDIVRDISFKGAEVATPMKTIEGKIIQDADRLDALGAIGIARTFAYGGSKNRLMYHPDIKPEMHDTFDKYKSSNAPSINHFYEKLLLLKDRMNTLAAKAIAEKRHAYMTQYLTRFFEEWEGED